MEWWGWVAWGISILTGAGGLILGLRAEARARYAPLWTIDMDGPTISFFNRTGEDAIHVGLVMADGWSLHNYRRFMRVGADEVARFATTPDDRKSPAPLAGVIHWMRPGEGRHYRMKFGESPHLATEIEQRLRRTQKRNRL